jgi:NAD-dependent aldehyde dehydrogenases
VFADVDPQMRIAQEEIFGPTTALIPVRDLDEAIASRTGSSSASRRRSSRRT